MTTHLPLPEMAASGALATGITGFFGWLSMRGREKTRANAYAQGAVDNAMKTAFGGMKTAMESVTGEVARLGDEVRDLRQQHGDCEKNLREVRADLDEIRQERQDLKAEIDRLMKGPVPGYRPRAPRNATPPR